ncbi:TrmH family RNA methyltransferase [Brevundimonas sp.]|uniref:TrmH family RNA methyltransferase n=1 Tax=Brevundimonas sp. TaxID=1871086 RepID=UPI00391D77A0
MTPVPIHDPEDARVADYRQIRERDLTGRRGLFVAEGAVVLNVLASPQSRCRAVSALIAEQRVETLRPVLERLDAPVYSAGQGVMDAVAGFPIHRGILALGEKPAEPDLADLLNAAPDDALVVVVCGVGNHDNMGGIFRNAAAFGAHAVLLDAHCCDPLYRKAIRVSVGAALRTPFMTALDPMTMLDGLEATGFSLLALSPSGEQPLSDVRPGGRAALILGAEGPGLAPVIMARCRTGAIPMAGGFDSLNVAATSAVALHQMRFG